MPPYISSFRRPPGQEHPIDHSSLAIFDSRVDNLPLLLAGLRPGITAHVLDPNRDGIEQISELIYQQPTAHLTLVAHGFPGGLQLGSNTLELSNLELYRSHLGSWFRTADVAQLNLLACHVAAGDAGAEFIHALAKITGAAITAAASAVGNGQWPPMAKQTFQPVVLEQYASTLVLTVKENIKDGTFDGGDPASNRLFGAADVAVSPDGNQLYIASAVESAVTVFNRDSFGNLAFQQTIRDGSDVGEISGSELLAGAFGVAVSPDGTQVFIASTGDDSLSVFSRDGAGNLTEQQLLRNTRPDPNNVVIDSLAGAVDVAVSADGSQVFVVSLTDSAITVFDRDGAGSLTFRQAIKDTQSGANELFGAAGVAVSPSGDQVFVVSQGDGAITVFDRDGSGNLTFRQAIKDGDGAQSLFGASSVAVSPDGNQVYVASATDAAITVFDRLADGRLTVAQVIGDGQGGAQLFGGSQNIYAGTGITGVPKINGFNGITISLDGAQVLVTSFADNGLTIFDRDGAGRLSVSQVIQDQAGSGADELAGTLGVALSPDGQQVFVTGFEDAAITAFNRDLAPSLVSIVRQTPAAEEVSADRLVFQVTFDESILNIDPSDFVVIGNTTASVTEITALSATAYAITISGGDLADLNGTVGLALAPTQTITDPIGNPLSLRAPAINETYTLSNGPSSPPAQSEQPAQLTPLSGLEITSLGDANTIRLQIDDANISALGEIFVFSTDASSRQQIANVSILKSGDLPDAYRPRFSLDKTQITAGQFLEFELVVNGDIYRAVPTAVSDTQVALDFDNGTQVVAETFTQTATTNLLVGDAAAIDLSGQTGLINVEFQVFRHGAKDNAVGLYTTDFSDGGIQDQLTGTILRPGDPGYREAALANQLDIRLTGDNGQVNTFSATLTGGGFLGMFLLADKGEPATSPLFFSHAGANNNNDHAKLLGDNTFGFEDLVNLGDRDFNDTVVQFSIQ